MNQQPGKLGIREYVAIAILMVGSKGTEDTPAALYNQVKNAGWMIPIVSAGLVFIPLFLLLKTMSLYPEKGGFSVIQKLLGKYIGFFVCLLIFVINSFAISMDSRTYTNIIRSLYFTTTPNVVIYAILMFVCAFGAKKGIQHIGSVSYIIIYYVIISVFVALALSTQDSTIQSIFPIWGPGKLEILIQSTKHIAIFGEFFLFTMLIPYITSGKDFRKGTWIAFVSVTISLCISELIFICLFDASMGGIGYPFHTAIRYISLGSYLPNVEIIFFVIWIMGAFIRFAAFLYINAMMFGHLFKIKDYEYLVPSLAVIYLMIGSIPETPIEVTIGLKPIVQIVAGPAFSVIAVLLWLVALLKGEFKHAKNKNSM